MRGKNKFENVISMVHEMSENYYDETIGVNDMEFESLTSMWIAVAGLGFSHLLRGCLQIG